MVFQDVRRVLPAVNDVFRHFLKKLFSAELLLFPEILGSSNYSRNCFRLVKLWYVFLSFLWVPYQSSCIPTHAPLSRCRVFLLCTENIFRYSSPPDLKSDVHNNKKRKYAHRDAAAVAAVVSPQPFLTITAGTCFDDRHRSGGRPEGDSPSPPIDWGGQIPSVRSVLTRNSGARKLPLKWGRGEGRDAYSTIFNGGNSQFLLATVKHITLDMTNATKTFTLFAANGGLALSDEGTRSYCEIFSQSTLIQPKRLSLHIYMYVCISSCIDQQSQFSSQE